MKKVLITILAIIMLAILGFGGFMIWKIYEKLDEQNGQISNLVKDTKGNEEENTVNNTVNNSVNNTTNSTNMANNTVNNTTNSVNNTTTQTTSTGSAEDKVKTLYYNYIKSKDEKNTEKLLEYKVDEVKVLSDSEKKSVLEFDGGQFYKETDTFAVVVYSVKPQNVNSTDWIVGNGEIRGDWIINKTACVCIRDGEILSDGTGW